MDVQGQSQQQPRKFFTGELKAKIMREHLEGRVALSILGGMSPIDLELSLNQTFRIAPAA